MRALRTCNPWGRKPNPRTIPLLSRWVFAAYLLGLPILGWSGGSGLNVLVVVNQNSTNSVRLGNAYCEIRSVPPNNLLRMTGWSGSTQTWSLAEFEMHLKSPLLQHIARHNLSNQIQYVLLSMEIPYRVRSQDNENSTTSALFYGFKTNTTVTQPGVPQTCSRPPAAESSYGFSEAAWPGGAPTNATAGESFLAMMLTGRSYEQAYSTLVRGAAADQSHPTNLVWLAKTSDAARNVRYLDFDNAAFEARVWGDNAIVITNSDSTSTTGLRGLSTGLFSFSLPDNAFVPGGLADSLTSFSGAIFEHASGTILSFLEGGAAATYGTVVEPCNVPAKFPNPLVYFYQDRGFNAAEAYYLSLGMPFQGLLLGEPLSAPFARVGSPGKLTYTNGLEMTDGAVLSGITPLSFTFYSPNLGTPLGAVDLFVDGTLTTNLATVQPQAGNVLNVTIGSSQIGYTVPPNATLQSLSQGVAAAINTRTNTTGIHAVSIGDRVLLRSSSPEKSGASPLLQVSVAQGTAARTTTYARAAQAVFVSSPASGFFGMAASNSPVAGDWLSLQFVLTNGQQVVVGITNTLFSTFMSDFVRLLITKVNATPELQGPNGVVAGDLYPYAEDRAAYFAVRARSPGWEAAQIQIKFEGSPGLLILAEGDRLIDNKWDLVPRNHLYLGAGSALLGATLNLDTSALPDGWHELTGVAYEGTSVRTQTRVTRKVRVKNTALEATLRFVGNPQNAPGDTPAEFEITANTNNVARIELFSTGGLVQTATNQSHVRLSVNPAVLGVGEHPFYALVTRADGARYRTETLRVRIVAGVRLSISGPPWLLTWNAEPGRTYQVLASTNLVNFKVAASVTTSNTLGQWLSPEAPVNAVFYRLNLPP